MNFSKSWYDDIYTLEDFVIYNPETVIKAITTNHFRLFLSGTSIYEVIAEKKQHEFCRYKR